ncbi:putative pas domain protein [Gigaspora margarita]|uniref:Putative pas domain protein n=1 Tax=Gigaspora margarita TaxID=4874 RepID=A0A8H4EQI2_GIGMA|nr:putative pas domain protein [Gigaspora margarita]
MSESTQTSSSEHNDTAPSMRRKKATRACFHCQKAHLTCDDSRPCQRCIKRDLAATCTDGIRKKAKYLQDSHYDASPQTNQTVFMHNGFQSTPTSTESLGPHNGFADIGMIDQNWQQQPQLQRTTSPVITTPGGMNGGSTSQKRENLGKKKMSSNTPENVYANVKTPFSYTEGFHYLVNWVKERMEKEHIERIVRALATFRPSFIALIMNLTEEDLIFMEKCFQRTILEFEKLISFSGTPTVVWRRTGEIALVGKEFLLLTQWTKDQLLGKTTYIYEVMDNQSAVEYWEKFAAHAFDNSRQSVMTTCILMRPSGLPVPCAFCFTIKRDIFDIPLAIVGNFLPILS